jgi:hypothetical protein
MTLIRWVSVAPKLLKNRAFAVFSSGRVVKRREAWKSALRFVQNGQIGLRSHRDSLNSNPSAVSLIQNAPYHRRCFVSGHLPEVRSERPEAREPPESAQGVEWKGVITYLS